MEKRILAVISVISLIFVLGCSIVTPTSTPASNEIVRKSEIGAKWQMYQIRTEIPAGGEFSLLIKLADGDNVDGYFYLEKGSNVDFRINANSLVYNSEPTAGKVASDRFSFTASLLQGSTYVLAFSNSSKEQDKDVVFLEVIFPIGGTIFMPFNAK